MGSPYQGQLTFQHSHRSCAKHLDCRRLAVQHITKSGRLGRRGLKNWSNPPTTIWRKKNPTAEPPITNPKHSNRDPKSPKTENPPTPPKGCIERPGIRLPSEGLPKALRKRAKPRGGRERRGPASKSCGHAQAPADFKKLGNLRDKHDRARTTTLQLPPLKFEESPNTAHDVQIMDSCRV